MIAKMWTSRNPYRFYGLCAIYQTKGGKKCKQIFLLLYKMQKEEVEHQKAVCGKTSQNNKSSASNIHFPVLICV